MHFAGQSAWIRRPRALQTWQFCTRLLLTLSLATACTGLRCDEASASQASAVWGSPTEYENNASTVSLATTRVGVSTTDIPGSLTLTTSGTANPIVEVAAGDRHTVGLRADGTVVATGDNNSHQGDVETWKDIVQISAGAEHTVGLKSDGTCVATGWGSEGECDVGSWTDVVQVEADSDGTFAVTDDGRLLVAGRDAERIREATKTWSGIDSVSASGGLMVVLRRDGTVLALASILEQDYASWTGITAIDTSGLGVFGLRADGTVVSARDSWQDLSYVRSWRDVAFLVAGGGHTLGLKSNGLVLAGGANEYGEANVGEWSDIVSLAAGLDHTVGLRSDGTVVATGRNDYGQCSVGSWSQIASVSAGGSHTLGLRGDGTVVAVGYNVFGQCETSSWTDIANISAGWGHSLGLKHDGTVLAVGLNNVGQSSVSAWDSIMDVAAGGGHSVGLKTDGTVLATGLNDYGQCDVSSWRDVAAVEVGDYHSVALKADGTVVATGNNYHGQCDVSAWRDIVAIAAGGSHTLGLKPDGTVIAAGLNTSRQCNVGSWAGITAIAAGRWHSVGLKSDGTVVAVGDDFWKQTTAVSRLTSITAVAAADYHTVGLTSDHTVVGVGDSQYRQCRTSWISDIVSPRVGMLGGVGDSVGLRAAVPTDLTLGGIEFDVATLRASEAVKCAVRLSADGATWTEPLGRDGRPIDWTNGVGNYFGRASSDPVPRTEETGLPQSPYVDIVLRLESGGVSSPEVRSVTARFASRLNSITYTAGAGGSLDGSATQTVARHASGSRVKALADPGHRFVSWNDGVKTAERVDRDITSNREYAADFVRVHTLSYSAGAGGSIEGSATQAVDHLSHGASVSAVADPGHRFIGWSDGVKTPRRAESGVTTDLTLSALFEAIPVPVRIGGANRYDVAVSLAREMEPSMAFPDVIIACGEDRAAADPLGAAALAATFECPVLLTPTAKANPSTLGAIKAMAAANGGRVNIHVIGGKTSIPPAVYNAYSGARGAGTVERIDGANRYELAARVALRVKRQLESSGGKAPGVIVVNIEDASSFNDALAVSPSASCGGLPLIGVRGSSVPREAANALAAFQDTPRYALNSAYLSQSVRASTGCSSVVASSANRETAADSIARWGVANGFASYEHIGLVNKLSDALPAGPLIGGRGGVLLYTAQAPLSPVTAALVTEVKAQVHHALTFGGPATIAEPTHLQFRSALQ